MESVLEFDFWMSDALFLECMKCFLFEVLNMRKSIFQTYRSNAMIISCESFHHSK